MTIISVVLTGADVLLVTTVSNVISFVSPAASESIVLGMSAVFISN